MRKNGSRFRLVWGAACLIFFFGCAQEEAADGVYDAGEMDLAEKPLPGDMVLIPAGEFTMGSDEAPPGGAEAYFAPEHTVDLPAYYIDVYEVTNGEFTRFQLESDYQAEGNWREYYSIGKEDFPVANVTWEDAKQFCEWAGKRLPTEAEWEKAARGTDGLAFPWGDEFNPHYSNTNEYGVRNLMEVGSIEEDKSPYGVYDMYGNVQEWSSELMRPYPGSPVPRSQAFDGRYVAVRGASYAMRGSSMRLWNRSGYFPKSQFGLGFRCVRDADQQEQ